MRRREFIGLLGGAAATWPISARGQQPDRMRRIGVLMGYSENDPETKARLAAFRQGLEQRGWSEGRNIRIDYRLGAPAASSAMLAKELVALQPDLIFAQGPTQIAAVHRESSTIPIVFLGIADPIGAGFIASLARPGGNITGLLLYEGGVVGKWLQMLKEIAPRLARAALVISPTSSFVNFISEAKTSASSLAIELLLTPVGDTAADIERVISSFALAPNSGLVLPADARTTAHRELIIQLAARHRLPAVYSDRVFVEDGGLMSYSPDLLAQHRQAAFYVNRIFRGDKPADLPVQAPTKFEMVLNLKTAKMLGLTVPPGLLVAADEVIE